MNLFYLQLRSPKICFYPSFIVADCIAFRWGCPPGWLCKPVQVDCNWEAGIPDRNFYCSPDECILAEALAAKLPTWDPDFYGNSTPATNPALKIDSIDDFFFMDPENFGLTYEVFVVTKVYTLMTTIYLPPGPTVAPRKARTVAARQGQTSIPGPCYPWCNNCLLEAQSNGKTSKLCVPGSAYEVSLNQCEQCITYHKDDSSGSFVDIAPQFQQFIDYCDQFTTVVVTTLETATITNAAGSSYSVATATISTNVVPKSSASTSPQSSPTHPISVATIITSTTTTLPLVSSTHVYTETVTTTAYAHSTISGSAWGSITIIMPLGNNSTSTIYGSDLTSDGATLILPVSPQTSTYTTDITIIPSGEVSKISTTASSTKLQAASSAASSTSSTFTGAASAFQPENQLRSAAVGLVVSLAAMLMM